MTNFTPGQINIIENMKPMLETSPWVLRIKERKNVVVLGALERVNGEFITHGIITYPRIRHCLDEIRTMLSTILDDLGRPSQVQALIDDKLSYRGDIPLNEETGHKLALLFILCPADDSQRSELLAWRIERLTREEAAYWLARITIPILPCFTGEKKTLAWARDGLRTMLCGHGRKDKELVQKILDVVRR